MTTQGSTCDSVAGGTRPEERRKALEHRAPTALGNLLRCPLSLSACFVYIGDQKTQIYGNVYFFFRIAPYSGKKKVTIVAGEVFVSSAVDFLGEHLQTGWCRCMYLCV